MIEFTNSPALPNSSEAGNNPALLSRVIATAVTTPLTRTHGSVRPSDSAPPERCEFRFKSEIDPPGTVPLALHEEERASKAQECEDAFEPEHRQADKGERAAGHRLGHSDVTGVSRLPSPAWSGQGDFPYGVVEVKRRVGHFERCYPSHSLHYGDRALLRLHARGLVIFDFVILVGKKEEPRGEIAPLPRQPAHQLLVERVKHVYAGEVGGSALLMREALGRQVPISCSLRRRRDVRKNATDEDGDATGGRCREEPAETGVKKPAASSMGAQYGPSLAEVPRQSDGARDLSRARPEG